MEFDVTVEIPKGTRNKYEMDPRTGRIHLDRTLFTRRSTPPTTASSSGPPAPTARPSTRCPGAGADVSGLSGVQPCDRHVPDARRAGTDTKVCASRPAPSARVHAGDGRRRPVPDGDRHFFEVYKAVEPGKSVTIEDQPWADRDEAEAEIKRAFERARTG